ncbi:MAG: class I mannose-6-phosphate isomerase, partial [Saprospiraceae bacterium]|nr:class I mannose-6-phosphate isomerase [Saprospiraceae bacterium]
VCDKIKKKLLPHLDFLLDLNDEEMPRMIPGSLFRLGLEKATHRPFRVVPFFDPGVWGGQWMREICDLPSGAINYAWCFDCVPEENSLLLGFGSERVEVPAIDLIFHQPKSLLGEVVFERFGAEFPIRFDFLDTMEGGNLSLQVHPVKTYMAEHFGLPYTQDESYYILDAGDDAVVYLGLKEGIDRDKMLDELELAEKGELSFEADRYIQKWPVKKHDHFLIPAGTIHCSGKDSMVLEISATPYIFTFKLWDWGRVDLDGKPRPISLEHGRNVIQWDRTSKWVGAELVNHLQEIQQGEGFREECTGLHETQFIETRRHWFTHKVDHHSHGNLNVLNLIEGDEVVVESPDDRFEPFTVHYAETFIIPAAVGAYSIRPTDISEGSNCATIKAFVRP